MNNFEKIIFGNNSIMIFMIKSDLKDIFEFDWENAQMEFQKEIEKENKNLEKRKRKKKLFFFTNL